MFLIVAEKEHPCDQAIKNDEDGVHGENAVFGECSKVIMPGMVSKFYPRTRKVSHWYCYDHTKDVWAISKITDKNIIMESDLNEAWNVIFNGTVHVADSTPAKLAKYIRSYYRLPDTIPSLIRDPLIHLDNCFYEQFVIKFKAFNSKEFFDFCVNNNKAHATNQIELSHVATHEILRLASKFSEEKYKKCIENMWKF